MLDNATRCSFCGFRKSKFLFLCITSRYRFFCDFREHLIETCISYQRILEKNILNRKNVRTNPKKSDILMVHAEIVLYVKRRENVATLDIYSVF